MIEKGRRPSFNPFIFKQGPIRPYVYTDIEETNNWLNLSLNEKIHLFILFIFSFLIRLLNINYLNFQIPIEFNFINNINNYFKNEFFFDLNPPFINLFYYYLSNLLNYNYNLNSNFPFLYLRILNILFTSISIILTYKTLKSTGINHLISLFGCYLLSIENSLLISQRLILNNCILIFLISSFISFHKIQQINQKFTLNWLFNILLTSIFLGLLFSSHWLGLFFLIYSFFSNLLELWTLIGDIHIPFKFALKNFIIKSTLYLFISLTIYLSIFKIHLNLLIKKGGNDYNLLSPNFQYSLLNNHLNNTFSSINYNSNIMIRNYKTGNYLHSHNDYFHYSNSQQVTLVQFYDDFNNLFKILPTNGDLNNLSPILPPFKINLKHETTNSLLLVDSNFKPPLSEQEYNFLLTTDKKFNNENNLNDLNDLNDLDDPKKYTFQLKMATNYCKTDASKSALRSIDSIFQIYNEQNDCYLLATPLKLNEGFSNGQFEIICIKEPNFESSLWFIDWNDNPNYSNNKKRINLKKFSFWEKLFEIHYLIIKKLFIGNQGYDNNNSNDFKLLDFILLKKGLTLWIDNINKKSIYLLGNFIIYYLIAISIIVYSILKIYQLATFNPFQYLNSSDSSTLKYDRKSLDYILLYIILILPFTFVKIELNLFDYLPCVFVGILLICQMFQWSLEKLPSITHIFIIIVSILASLAFIKFSPLIYGLDWTQTKCLKMMVSPEWDRELCNIYNS